MNDKNLLFLEDNDDFIQNATTLFSIIFAHVYTAKTISEAKEFFAQKKIDIILSDVHLRNENGLDFIEYIRALDPVIPILILSGYKDEDLLFRAIPLGLSGYLLKPLNYKAMNEAFENCAKVFHTLENTLVKLKDDFYYDTQRKVIIKDDIIYELNKKEILFFEMVIENKNRIFTKEMFSHYVYETGEMSDSALINFVMRIRKRFGKDFLHTVADVGYKMTL